MKIIKVNMSTGKKLEKKLKKDQIIGGRVLIDHFLTHHTTIKYHPLSAKSPFIVAPGLFAGTNVPSSGRTSIGGKSPLTGGIKEANVGGTVGHMLGKLEIQGLIIEGTADKLKLLKISKSGIEIENAEYMKGMKNYESCEAIHKKFGDKVGIILIGPAGENKLSSATVAVSDMNGNPTRHAARGGLGAVMGAKGLKAIVIDDTGCITRQPADKDCFMKCIKETADYIKNSPYTKILHKYGTAFAIDKDNQQASMPAYNFKHGSFEDYKKINGEKLLELCGQRNGVTGHGCMPGCIIKCSNIFNDEKKKYITSALEYETIAIFGSNLGINNLDTIAKMDRKCDDLGVDTIEIGCTIGLLSEVDVFKFGDDKKALSLIDEIEKGTSLGKIIGSGTEITAKIYGISRVPAVKGQGLPAHLGRTLKGLGTTYATSPQGADHTAGYVSDDSDSNVGCSERSRKSQVDATVFDSTGFCFMAHMTPERIVPLINGLYGSNWNTDKYIQIGKDALMQEHDFNTKAGISHYADGVPEWMEEESLPENKDVFDVPENEIENFFNFEK
jgi:aldehyde:ferredoxin oxidoreductase